MFADKIPFIPLLIEYHLKYRKILKYTNTYL